MVDRYTIFKTESQNSNHPSFSSTLLDAVYRSIDQGEKEEQHMAIYRESTKKKQNYNSDPVSKVFRNEEEMANFQRACMIEKWMEKKVSEKVVVVRRKSVPDLQTKKSRKDRQNSSSSSSDSSVGGFFSSSEAESFPVQRPKPVRTGGCGFEKQRLGKILCDFETSRCNFADQKPKSEGGFLKTKSRALKIYGDLKKVKQPISPGGKLAGFLNSIFTNGNTKKPKNGVVNGEDSPSLKSANTSTCSSASSFSRSCLSKTPSSGGKTYNGVKRSVKFFPVSVIVDEDCQPCGHKSLHQEKNIKKQSSHLDSVKNNNNNVNDDLMEKNRRVEEVAREFLQKYQKKNQAEYPACDNLRNSSNEKNQMFVGEFEDEDDDEDDDDAASYASSDLFELDNLSAIGIGMERYREELPVYETTHLDTNRAIANGFNL